MRAAALIAAAALLAAVAAGRTGVTHTSWSAQNENPATAVSAAILGDPGSPAAATTTTTCTPVNVSWTTDPLADSYEIEVRLDGGAWSSANADTGNVSTWADPTGYANVDVEYRIRSILSGTAWHSAWVQTPVLECGVNDLAATNPCSKTVLTWTPAAAATTYDVQRRVNGGAWSGVVNNYNDGGTGTYTMTTVHPNGSVVEYRIRPGIGNAGNGSWSTIATIGDWQAFYVQSVSVANGGAAGVLDANDTLTINFSKPVATATIPLANSMRTRTGATNYLYLAATANTNQQIGRLTLPVTWSATANHAGVPVWNGDNTQLTWTSTGGAGTNMVVPLATTGWTRSTVARCEDGTTTLATTPTPATAGQW